MEFRKLIISLLGTALLTSSVGLSTTTASADTLDDSQNTTEVQPKNLKWAYPFKANKKNGVRPMYNAQTFGITNYMRSTTPPSYFHDGWDFGFSERSEEHTSELQSRFDLVCRLL